MTRKNENQTDLTLYVVACVAGCFIATASLGIRIANIKQDLRKETLKRKLWQDAFRRAVEEVPVEQYDAIREKVQLDIDFHEITHDLI